MASFSSQLPLVEWVEKWNDLVFFQPDDQLSARTLSETVNADTKVKINHDIHDVNCLTEGVHFVRHTTATALKSNELLQSWVAPDGIGGCTVHKTIFTNTDKASGKATTKLSLVTTIVKSIDGKRKVAGLVEVETEQ